MRCVHVLPVSLLAVLLTACGQQPAEHLAATLAADALESPSRLTAAKHAGPGVAVQEVAVTTGTPTSGRGVVRCEKMIHPDESRKCGARLFPGAGYGNNTSPINGLFRPRSAAWLS